MLDATVANTGAAAPPVATIIPTAATVATVPITTFPTVEEAKSFTAPTAFFNHLGALPSGSTPKIGLL